MIDKLKDPKLSSILNRVKGKQAEVGFYFKLNILIFWIFRLSLFIQRQFDVKLNGNNQLSLLKTAEGSLRIKLDFDGNREDGSYLYNLNLPQEETVKVFSLEYISINKNSYNSLYLLSITFFLRGKFFKLGNSGYVPVTNFKIPQKTKNICTSSNFHKQIGLDVCLSAIRPEGRSIKQISDSLKNRENDMDVYEDEDDFDFDAIDDDDDDDGDDDRPMLTLSGPYRYEVK